MSGDASGEPRFDFDLPEIRRFDLRLGGGDGGFDDEAGDDGDEVDATTTTLRPLPLPAFFLDIDGEIACSATTGGAGGTCAFS